MKNVTKKNFSVKKLIVIVAISFILLCVGILLGTKGNNLTSSGLQANLPSLSYSRSATDNLETSESIVGGSVNAPTKSSMIAYDSLSTEDGGLDSTSTEKKIIKSGNLTLKVEETEKAIEEVASIVKNHQGQIFSSNISEAVKNQKSGYLVVKVPFLEFESSLEDIKKIATQVVNENTSGQDVSEQYVDLAAQLKNKQAEEESFLKILEQSGEIADVLAVTKELSRVRGEIERLQGKIRYLDSRTDLATITIYLSEDVQIISDQWRPLQVLKQSVDGLIERLQNLADGLIRFFVIGLPLILIFLVFFYLIFILIRKIVVKHRIKNKK